MCGSRFWTKTPKRYRSFTTIQQPLNGAATPSRPRLRFHHRYFFLLQLPFENGFFPGTGSNPGQQRLFPFDDFVFLIPKQLQRQCQNV
jgi:hypothetical protein